MIIGLTRGTTKYHVIRATLDSIAYQVTDVVELMKEETGINISRLRVDGGASANNLLMSIQSDTLGCEIERPECVETTALGAAFLCGLATGFYPSTDAIREYRRTDKLFTTEKDDKWREETMNRWHKAVSRSLEWI